MVRKDRTSEKSTKRNGRQEPNAPIQIALWTPTHRPRSSHADLDPTGAIPAEGKGLARAEGREASASLAKSDPRSLLLGFPHLPTRVPLRHLDGRAASYGWYSSAEANAANVWFPPPAMRTRPSESSVAV